MVLPIILNLILPHPENKCKSNKVSMEKELIINPKITPELSKFLY